MPGYDLAPDPLNLALSRELREGERVLWQGRQIARLSLKSFAIYGFAIPWTVFALMWTAGASAGAMALQDEWTVLSWAFPLFGLPFILIGFGMLAMPFAPWWRRGRVLFAVTNEQVLEIILGRKSLNIQSVPAERIGHVRREEFRDGTGTLKLSVKIGRDSDGDPKTEHFLLGEVADVLTAQDKVSEIGNASFYRRRPYAPTEEGPLLSS